jgi:hypothetical protein
MVVVFYYYFLKGFGGGGGGEVDPMSSMTLGFFPFPKMSQLPSNLFISNMDHNGGFFSILLRKCHNFHKI